MLDEEFDDGVMMFAFTPLCCVMYSVITWRGLCVGMDVYRVEVTHIHREGKGEIDGDRQRDREPVLIESCHLRVCPVTG